MRPSNLITSSIKNSLLFALSMILFFAAGNAQARYKHIPRIKTDKKFVQPPLQKENMQLVPKKPAVEHEMNISVQTDRMNIVNHVDSYKVKKETSVKIKRELPVQPKGHFNLKSKVEKKAAVIGAKKMIKPNKISSTQKTLMSRLVMYSLIIIFTGALSLLFGFLFAYGILTYGAGIFGPVVTGVILIVIGTLAVLAGLVFLIIAWLNG